jgi:hypothetical protein
MAINKTGEKNINTSKEKTTSNIRLSEDRRYGTTANAEMCA